MEEVGYNGQTMTLKKGELGELLEANTAQESQNADILCYHSAILTLHKKERKTIILRGPSIES